MRRALLGNLLRRACTAILFLLWVAAASGASARAYRIGTDDLLRVSFYDRPELSGEYRVRPPGVLSLPLVGELEVSGQTLSDLERAIASRLLSSSERKGHLVNVEIKEYRPFFIVGDVERPGRYPCGPDMTVMRAVAVAGGLKILDSEGFTVRAEIYRAEEKLRHLREAFGLALLQQARYRAEADDQEQLTVPEGLVRYMDPSRMEEAVAQEQALLRERLIGIQREIDALEQSKGVFEEEIKAHREKIAAETQRVKLLELQRSELDDVDQRLVPKMVIWELQREMVTAEGNKRELEAYIARARQQMDEKDHAVLRLRNARLIEITAGLKQAADDMANVRASIDETERFLTRAKGWVVRTDQELKDATGGFLITRDTSEEPVQLTADGGTEVLPGDLITVLPTLRSARYR